MRGKVQRQRMHARARRITPAYAGKRVRCSQQALPRTDHPRMCGEKYKIKKRYPLEMGSPPRMRGKAKHTHAFQFRHRITPACAGKRLCLTCVLAILWDHPRMCGEKWLARFKPFATRGSPPHVRGKGVVHILVPEPLGITPAYAGKSSCAMRAA